MGNVPFRRCVGLTKKSTWYVISTRLLNYLGMDGLFSSCLDLALSDSTSTSCRVSACLAIIHIGKFSPFYHWTGLPVAPPLAPPPRGPLLGPPFGGG